MVRDLFVSARALARSPLLTITASLTIGLGIGATTAIFSVANGVLLRPLPYEDPDRLVVVYADLRARENYSMPMSFETFSDIRNGTKNSFEDVAAVQTGPQVLPAADGSPERLRVALVTTNIFRVLGARVAIGRDFEESDGIPQPGSALQGTDAGPPPPPRLPTIVILSHDYWQRRYGGNPDIVGQRIAVGGGPVGLQIVGVLAPEVELLFPPQDNVERRPDIWLANRRVYDNANRNAYGLRPIGRLKSGVPLSRAQDELDVVSAGIRRDFPIFGAADYYGRVEPMHAALVADVRPVILALLGAVFFFLLIACANVANLLLVRASLRHTEVAVRSALGAEWTRLVRQLMTEAALISALGTAVGTWLAWLGVRALVALAPANLPRLNNIGVDPAVLVFGVACGIGAAMLFGLVPAWSVFRLDVMTVLRGATRAEGLGGGRALRNAVVVAQVACCFVLLIGSGLMFRSYLELQRINPGFEPSGLLTFEIVGGFPGSPPERATMVREMRGRLSALPGVERVTATQPLPLGGGFSTIRWGTEDALVDNSKYQAVDWQRVLPGYFETMRTPLIAGRTFTEADNDSRAAVVVVDEVLAAKAFPSESAVGRRILIRVRTPEPEWVEIIGVVGRQRVTSLSDAGREQVYFTDGFLNFGGARKFAIRTAGDPSLLADLVRSEVKRVSSDLLLVDMEPMSALVQRAQAGTRFQLMLIALFAIGATLLVAVGLYGVLSTVVRQRTAEIGVRMAMGAAPSGILTLIVRHGLRLTVLGMFLGFVAAVALTRLMRTMLIGVTATDPSTYAVMTIVFLSITAVAAWLPARRAAALDPVAALRE